MPASVHRFLIGAAARNGEDVRASFAEQLTIGQLITFNKPIVIAYGSDSPAIVAAIAKAIASFMQQARLHVVPGTNHGMLDSHPARVAQLILAGANV